MPGQSQDELSEPRLALCCISKPGFAAVNRWITHHLDMGFDRIYIYHTGRSAEVKNQVIPKFRKKIKNINLKNQVEYTTEAYAHCYRNYRHKYDWMAFIDQGEYILTQDGRSVKQILANPEYMNFEVIRINMVDFSDFNQMAGDLNINWASEDIDGQKQYAKSIVNCRARGIYLRDNAPTRDQKVLRQCLPNLQKVKDADKSESIKGIRVDKVDTSVMYLTTNLTEIRWKKWKLEKSY